MPDWMLSPDSPVRTPMHLKSVLALEDGTLLHGRGFGSPKTTAGELVFNTGMTGYQEALTDPSYNGQILMMTYPLIGNYGINPGHQESPTGQVRGFIVREVCTTPSHRFSHQGIDEFLKTQNIPGICEIDTRMLTIKIRKYGTMKAVIKTYDSDTESGDQREITKLLKQAKSMALPEETNLVADVSCKEVKYLKSSIPPGRDKGPKIVLIDCGSKINIIRELTQRNCEIICVPYNMPAQKITRLKPDGILLSNGPGNPAHPEIIATTVKTIREICERYPIMGICLGHQILSLVFGARTYKLKFGHRGANQPVKDTRDNRVYITSQNHGFAVEPDSCPEEIEMVGVNVNDGTLEAMQHRKLPVFSVQYYPEVSDGPWNNKYLFDRFIALCQNGKT